MLHYLPCHGCPALPTSLTFWQAAFAASRLAIRTKPAAGGRQAGAGGWVLVGEGHKTYGGICVVAAVGLRNAMGGRAAHTQGKSRKATRQYVHPKQGSAKQPPQSKCGCSQRGSGNRPTHRSRDSRHDRACAGSALCPPPPLLRPWTPTPPTHRHWGAGLLQRCITVVGSWTRQEGTLGQAGENCGAKKAVASSRPSSLVHTA